MKTGDTKSSPSSAFIRRKKQTGSRTEESDKRKALLDVLQRNLSDELEQLQAGEDLAMQCGPQILQILFKNEGILIFGLILFRLLNALLVQTYYVPDEYWQSVEVAHNAAFGYGYLTWEWRLGIRSYVYPLIFAAAYRFLGIFRLDNWQLLV